MPTTPPPDERAPAPARPSRRTGRNVAWYWLLVLPYIGTLWVPFYNRVEPMAGGIPFFYWYQFVWIGISTVLTAIVYFATRDSHR